MDMATKNPRIQVMLERPLYDLLADLADRDGVSMSTKAHDLIEDALEQLEDMILLAIAEERIANPQGKSIPLKEVRKRLGL